jgi:hypothetical protein
MTPEFRGYEHTISPVRDTELRRFMTPDSHDFLIPDFHEFLISDSHDFLIPDFRDITS